MTLEFVRSWDVEEGRAPERLEDLREQYAEGRLANDCLPNEVDFRDWLAAKIGDVHALWLPGTWPSVAVQGRHTVCGELRQWALLGSGGFSAPTCDLCVMILRGDLGRAADLIIAARGRLPEISYGRCEVHQLQACQQCGEPIKQPVEPGPVAPTLARVPTQGIVLGAVSQTSPTTWRQKMTCVCCGAETYFLADVEGAAETAIADHWKSSPSCRNYAERLDGKAFR